MNNKYARFMTFEGGEGSGKSTQSFMLHEYLKSKNIPVLLTREIGGTPEAEKIREIVLYSELLPISELMLVMAARFEHVHKVIIPALRNNIIVICDRFIDSTACYQGQCQDIGIDKVYRLHDEIIGIVPDITFFIDISPELALQRTLGRPGNNKFEDKDLKFHQNVHKGFKHISRIFEDRIIQIEAETLSREQVHEKILQHI